MSTVLDWLRGSTLSEAATTGPDENLSEQLRAEQDNALMLLERLADLELALDDRGWERLGDGRTEFTRDGLRRMTALCTLFSVDNPLIKRGLNLRTFYVWGLGVSIQGRAQGDDTNTAEQDVNAVVQTFLDDQGNQATLTGDQAHEELERELGTAGNVFLALFTDPATGRVQVRTLPFDEVDDVITNPDDRAEPRFYKRRWTTIAQADVAAGTTSTRTEHVAYYPALGYQPVGPRVTTVRVDGTEQPVHWDTPVLHVKVNAKSTWKFGVPDAYAAIAWARAHKEFLEDWAKLAKSLARFAWRLTAPGSKASRAAAAATLTKAPPRAADGTPDDVGAVVSTPAGAALEAIPKSGATIDSESSRPLAMMVAAALDVPVTMLLSDPGQTGARATAETLDRPTELMAGMRRKLWAAALQRILGYVVDQAVKAPRGPLRGTVARDRFTGAEVITLAGDTERTVDVTFPDLDEVDPVQAMLALKAADDMQMVPPLVILRLVLQLLRVEDIDEVIDDATDDQGNLIRPDVTAGDVATRAFRNGQDPATAVGDGTTPPAPASEAATPPAPQPILLTVNPPNIDVHVEAAPPRTVHKAVGRDAAGNIATIIETEQG